MDDLGTPIELSKHLEAALHDAGVSVQLVTIDDAPKLAPLTHPVPVNTAIENFIVSQSSMNRPPTPRLIISPWDEDLKGVGWVPPSDIIDSDDSHEEEGTKLFGTDDTEVLELASKFVN
ncbi:hypothetical protein DL96DRAFT_1712623 [Flagelloscypha sp. PMI_526]|nr:hypothetical protein DL96DRAFT_1712623 [Flagelloscypha sp. PMI_526]